MKMNQVLQMVKNKPYIWIILLIVLAIVIYFISTSNLFAKNILYMNNNKVSNYINTKLSIPANYQNKINPIIETSSVSLDNITDPERVIYKTTLIEPTTSEIFNTSDKDKNTNMTIPKLPQVGVINDFISKSYAKLSRRDLDTDQENKKPILLEFSDFKVIYPVKLQDGTFKTETKQLTSLENIYLQFLNDDLVDVINGKCYKNPDETCKTYAQGIYKILVAIKDKTTNKIEEVMKTEVELKSNEKEILLNFENPIQMNPNKTILLGIRKQNDKFVYISEILLNFKGRFEDVKKRLLIINEQNLLQNKVYNKIELTLPEDKTKELMKKESESCPAGHMYLNTGNLESSRCVKTCKSVLDCEDAQFETGVNSNEYKKIENSVCVISNVSTKEGNRISYCKPKIQIN